MWTGADGLLSRRGRCDRSQAIYCLEYATQRTRPVGNGMIKVAIVPLDPMTFCELNVRITPSATGRIALGRIPGNKFPGYLHSVRTRQRTHEDVEKRQ